MDFHALGVATLAASAHKFHGPVGDRALAGAPGSQASIMAGWRWPAARPAAGNGGCSLGVGLASALERWHTEAAARTDRWIALRDRLESGLISALGPEQVVRNGPVASSMRLPQTVNLGFVGLDGDALLMQLDLEGIAASLGAACASGSTRPSPTWSPCTFPAIVFARRSASAWGQVPRRPRLMKRCPGSSGPLPGSGEELRPKPGEQWLDEP